MHTICMSEQIDPSEFTSGERWRRRVANGLSIARAAFAAVNLHPSQELHPIRTAAIFATDKLDGTLVRGWGEMRDVTTDTGKRIDDISDKLTTGMIGLKLIVTENPSYHPAFLVTDVLRNIAMTHLRNQASEAGVDVRARPLGKIKLATQAIASTVSSTQAAQRGEKWAVRTALALHTVGAALSVYSYFDAKSNFDQQLAETQQSTEDAQGLAA